MKTLNELVAEKLEAHRVRLTKQYGFKKSVETVKSEIQRLRSEGCKYVYVNGWNVNINEALNDSYKLVRTGEGEGMFKTKY